MKAIRSKSLIDGTGRAPITNAVVLVEGERIIAVGPATNITVPPDAEVIDLSSETLLPGFIDVHSHCVLRAETRTMSQQMGDAASRLVLRAANNVRQDLLSGVTTMRTLGDPYLIDVQLRDAIAEGDVPGPRLLVSGPVLRTTHGPGITLGPGSDGVDAVRRQVRESIFKGADVVKIFATGWLNQDPAQYQVHQFTKTAPFSREEIHAIVEEAHRVGVPVTAHAHCGQGLKDCVEANIDSIEHAHLMGEEELELFMKHGTRLNGTNVVLFDPQLGLMAKKDFHTVPEYRDAILEAQERTMTMHRQAIAGGVKYCFATDARHGHFASEFDYAIDLGMTPMQAIVAATCRAAELLNMSDRIGTIETGKLADIISVPGNPLQDLSHLKQVGFVMKSGKRYDHLRQSRNGVAAQG